MLANVSALDVHTPNAEIRRIQKVVAEFMGVPLSSMLSKDKVREVVFARQVAMTLCGDLVPIGAREIARNFRSDTDPGTVRFARSRVQEECKINPVFNKMYQELKEKLKHE